jgi:hypothetical protein
MTSNRHPLTKQDTPELRQTIAGYEQKIAYCESIGLDQSDRRVVLTDLLTELAEREA